MKLSGKQKNQLFGILYDLERSYRYIQNPNVVGIAHEIPEGRENGGDYKIINPECIISCYGSVKQIRIMNKNIGSDIAGLEMGISRLKSFIEVNTEQ